MKIFTTKSSKDGPVVYINNWIIIIPLLIMAMLFVVATDAPQIEEKIEYKNVMCT